MNIPNCSELKALSIHCIKHVTHLLSYHIMCSTVGFSPWPLWVVVGIFGVDPVHGVIKNSGTFVNRLVMRFTFS